MILHPKSGSVGSDNWATTMQLIAKYWINGAIRPNGSPECGNHVAARSYSTNSVRFLDFTPPDSYQSSYSDYVSSVFLKEPFMGGIYPHTYTADALERNGFDMAFIFTTSDYNI